MASVLIVHASREGHTARIAERLARVLGQRGHDARLAPAFPFPLLAGADAVLVAASVHRGRHPRALVRALRAHRTVLQHLPTGFLSVCLSAAVDDPEHRARADRYLQDFLAATQWRPDVAASAAGALCFSRYGPVKRRFMRTLARREGLPPEDRDYTDWNDVRAFAEAFCALVDRRERARFRPPAPRLAIEPAGG